MAQDVTPTLERLLDQFLPVEPGSIEAEFDRIWQDASSGSYDTSSVRLRVSNFIAWGGDAEGEAGERFEHVIGLLAQRHPCRAILAVTAADAGSLQSAISAHCWRTAVGGRHICSEEILLRGRPSGEREMASALLALLVPELPVHLWLIGDPDAKRRVPEELLDLADRLYVDSAAGAASGVALRAIAAALSDRGPAIIDLAWERTTAWRELAAQFFDGPRTSAELQRLTEIEIDGGAGGVSAAALLLAGWLAASLELSLASVEASNSLVRATFYDGTRGVQLQVAPSAAGMEIERVKLATGGAEFYIELHPASGHMHVRSDFAEEPVHRTVAPEPDDDASVLTAAVEDTSAPETYARALRAALELLG